MEKAKWEKFIDQNIDIMIVSVLKTCSDKNHPRTINFIREELGNRFFVDSDENGFGSGIKEAHMNKRIRRKLSELCDLGRVYVGEDIDPITWPEGVPEGLPLDIYRILGGRVVLAESDEVKGKKEEGETHSNYYYFEPILSESDVHYINSAVESNHYLSEEEKEYLVARTAVAGGYWGKKGDKKTLEFYDIWTTKLTDLPQLSYLDLRDNEEIPELRPEDTMGKLPSEGSTMLKKVMILRYAITNKRQIEVVQGNYVPGERGKLCFRERDGGKKIRLNPYAMISQKGQLYLIATCAGEKNTKHYRVDRIMALRVLSKKEKREEIPDELRDNYFKKNKFQPEDYISAYPMMRYASNDKRINFTFRCQADVVSLAVDNFGKVMKIEDDDSEGYVKITVRDKSYINARQFLIQNCDFVTPLEPKELVQDVKDTLEDAIKRISL